MQTAVYKCAVSVFSPVALNVHDACDEVAGIARFTTETLGAQKPGAALPYSYSEKCITAPQRTCTMHEGDASVHYAQRETDYASRDVVPSIECHRKGAWQCVLDLDIRLYNL